MRPDVADFVGTPLLPVGSIVDWAGSGDPMDTIRIS